MTKYNWRATDLNGNVHEYVSKPIIYESEWVTGESSTYRLVSSTNIIHEHWKDTLEEIKVNYTGFKNAQIGDTVHCCVNGIGTITSVTADDTYPIEVDFAANKDIYTLEGKLIGSNKFPSLYWHELEEIVPTSRPMNWTTVSLNTEVVDSTGLNYRFIAYDPTHKACFVVRTPGGVIKVISNLVGLDN